MGESELDEYLVATEKPGFAEFISYAVGYFIGGHRDPFFQWSYMQRLWARDGEAKSLNGEYVRCMSEDKQVVLELLSGRDALFANFFDEEDLVRKNVPTTACKYCQYPLNVRVRPFSEDQLQREVEDVSLFRIPAQVGVIFSCPRCEWWRVIKHSNILHDELPRHVNYIYEGIIQRFSARTSAEMKALVRRCSTSPCRSIDDLHRSAAGVLGDMGEREIRFVPDVSGNVALVVAESSNPSAFLIERSAGGLRITQILMFLGYSLENDELSLWMGTGGLEKGPGPPITRLSVSIQDVVPLINRGARSPGAAPWEQVFGSRPAYGSPIRRLWYEVAGFFT